MNTDKNFPAKTWPPFWIYFTGVVGVIYILNPTMGVFELIPDNLPIIGNLDEGAAAILIWNAVQQIRATRKIK
jgi:uncharacterized membrane protein YkvA (DUF1232 family)